jgi:hypothetical protein
MIQQVIHGVCVCVCVCVCFQQRQTRFLIVSESVEAQDDNSTCMYVQRHVHAYILYLCMCVYNICGMIRVICMCVYVLSAETDAFLIVREAIEAQDDDSTGMYVQRHVHTYVLY